MKPIDIHVFVSFTFIPGERYPGHSGESFCGSELSLDESSGFDQLEEGIDGSSGSGPVHDLGPGGMGPPIPYHHTNPIDKLYMMQNSYFSSTEQ